MNVGLYSGAAGMRVGQDYQTMITANLANESVPGYRQTIPVFSTDMATASAAAQSPEGNPSAIKMTTTTDFSQGPIQPGSGPFSMAIEGKAFFEVREADGKTSYTRNGAFTVTPQGQVVTADGASVLGAGGSALTVDPKTASMATVASDGTISVNGTTAGKVDFAHFDHPSQQLQASTFGRFTADKKDDAKEGLATGDHVVPNSVEGANSNPVQEMANMIMAVRFYEANQKSIQAVDDNTNQLITTVGGRPS